jgi:phosphoglucosamine mutase
MVREQRPLSSIAGVFQASPQELVNIKVGRKVPLEQLPAVQAVIEEVTGALGNDGRVLVRYSGTEMKCRVMVEGPDAATVGSMARRIADALVAALA